MRRVWGEGFESELGISTAPGLQLGTPPQHTLAPGEGVAGRESDWPCSIRVTEVGDNPLPEPTA